MGEPDNDGYDRLARNQEIAGYATEPECDEEFTPGGFICSLPLNHPGDHDARDGAGVSCHTWPRP